MAGRHKKPVPETKSYMLRIRMSQDDRPLGQPGEVIQAIPKRVPVGPEIVGEMELLRERSEQVALRLDSRWNLGDERGILFLGGIGSTPNGAVQAGLIRPRTIGLTLSASY